jgi:hypothetical protein
MVVSRSVGDAPLIAFRTRAETTARRSTVFQMQDLKDRTMSDHHSEPTPAAIDRILVWRKHLNSLRPCVVLAVDFLSDRIETHVFLDRAAPGSIRLSLNGDGRPITAANIAAALGPRDVAHAAARLVDAAAGCADHDPVHLCRRISAVLFDQVARYPLDRPDTSSPPRHGPS